MTIHATTSPPTLALSRERVNCRGSATTLLIAGRYDAEMRALLMQCADIRADTVMRRIAEMREQS